MKKNFLTAERQTAIPEKALFHILPIPYASDSGACRGMDRGPDAALDASALMGNYDYKTGKALNRFGVYTHDPIPGAENAAEQMRLIENAARKHELFRPRRLPIAIGGERSVTGPLVRVAAEQYRELSVVQLSAHCALKDKFGKEGPDSYAAVMARVAEVVPEFVQVGVREVDEEEAERFPKKIDELVSVEEITDNFESAVEKILWKTDIDVYLTIDMDVFDPGAAPGVGVPVPGGLEWRHVVAVLEEIVAAKNLVGADVVGIKPIGDQNIITECAAARLVGKIIDAVSRKKD